MKAEDIRLLGEIAGIPMMGFLDGSPLTDALPHLKERFEKEGMPAFVHTSPEKRIDYQAFWKKTKSVIVIAIPYELKTECFAGDELHGRFASFCKGVDYHVRVKEKCLALAELMKKMFGDFDYRIEVDNVALVDRAAAWQAGLGFYGKNNLLINERYGSAFNIGQLLIDQEIEFIKPQPPESKCGDCDRCLKACPNGALEDGFALDGSKCISCLTQKKTLTDEEARRIKIYLFGCDHCQLVCPYNTGTKPVIWDNTALDRARPKLSTILEMDDAQFAETFKQSNMNWRGAKILKRNAKLQKNYNNDKFL